MEEIHKFGIIRKILSSFAKVFCFLQVSESFADILSAIFRINKSLFEFQSGEFVLLLKNICLDEKPKIR